MSHEQESALVAPSDTSQGNPVVTAVLVLGILSVAVFAWNEAPTAELAAAQAPALAHATSSCPAASADQQVRGQALLQRAQVRWERGVFDPASAIRALRDGEQALACLKQGSSPRAVQEATTLVQQMRGQLERDYRRLRLRLRVALERDDHASARESIAALRALIGDENDPYVRWLVSRERALHAQGGAP